MGLYLLMGTLAVPAAVNSAAANVNMFRPALCFPTAFQQLRIYNTNHSQHVHDYYCRTSTDSGNEYVRAVAETTGEEQNDHPDILARLY